MSQRIINIGTQPGSNDGEEIRNAFDKINQNFTEVYSTLSGISSPVLKVAGRTGNIVLTINDIIGAVNVGYVEERIESIVANLSVPAVPDTTAKRSDDGSIYANKIYYSNKFLDSSDLPPAEEYTGMIAYVDGSGFSASDGNVWVNGFGSAITTKLNDSTIGAEEKVKKLNFTGDNIRIATVEDVDDQINISVDPVYSTVTVVSGLDPTVIDSFHISQVRAAKFLVHITSLVGVFFAELNVLNYETGADLTEYGSLGSNFTEDGDIIRPGDFITEINDGEVALVFVPTVPDCTIRLNRYAIIT